MVDLDRNYYLLVDISAVDCSCGVEELRLLDSWLELHNLVMSADD